MTTTPVQQAAPPVQRIRIPTVSTIRIARTYNSEKRRMTTQATITATIAPSLANLLMEMAGQRVPLFLDVGTDQARLFLDDAEDEEEEEDAEEE